MERGREAGTGQEALDVQDHSWTGQEGGLHRSYIHLRDTGGLYSLFRARGGCFPQLWGRFSSPAGCSSTAQARPGLPASGLLREHRSRCGPALPLRRNCAAMCHQLTAHYYKTLPPGFKRLEESRSGFSWSHSQRSVPLTLETKCLVLKIINGKYDLKKKKCNGSFGPR